MVGVGQVALDSAPVFGGALLAIAAGQFRGPDYRGSIQQDMDLLERLPPEAIERRDALRRSIDARVDELIDSADRSRAVRRAALSYRGNWRDVVVAAVYAFRGALRAASDFLHNRHAGAGDAPK